MTNDTFPGGFIWGAAAASFQIEGAAYADGKGLSVWDHFCKIPGTVWDGHTGEVACDHYHRWQEDIAIMREIGLKAYRLSISWPRVIPAGTGQVNPAGLEFYDRLVEGLLAAGIQPFVTLFHWDYPYELYQRGGWLNRDSSDWFAEYVKVIVDRLSDRVQHWMTLNEPQVYIGMGHGTGEHAPGLELDLSEVLRAAHNTLLAHGKAVQVIRSRTKAESFVGYAPVGSGAVPAGDSPADVEAARIYSTRILEKTWWNNTWWSDPVILGHYPADGMEMFAAEMPEVRPGDMETIHQPVDFYGVNIYQAPTVRAGEDGLPEVLLPPDGTGLTSYPWPVTPDALYWTPKFLFERYAKPIYITENGMANNDWVALDGKVHDPQRIDFTQRYLRSLRRAIADGVDVRGYFHWSIMDNFEWAKGYNLRFGMVYVDYATQVRTLKDSAVWYKSVIAANGTNL